MSHFVPKHKMTEEDIKLQYITPAITAKWPLSRITMETQITDGKINLKGNLVVREKPKKADYVLYLQDEKPIAIVEAKDNKHTVSYGIQQAITYAQMLDVPFAYSSNGDAFYEHDRLTGQERQIDLDKFPAPNELLARYKAEKGLTPAEIKAINQPYYTTLPVIIRETQLTVLWKPLLRVRIASCWSWQPVQARPTRLFRSCTAC